MISQRSIRRVVERFSLAPTVQGAAQGAGDMQVVLDASASMASGGGSKAQRARELAIALLKLCDRASSHSMACAVRGSERDRVIRAVDADGLAHLPFDGTTSLDQAWPAHRLPPASLRVVISDFMFPADPIRVVQQAIVEAARLFLVQLLDPWEAEPEVDGTTRLLDAESAEEMEVVLDSATIEGYRQRLAELQEGYAMSCSTVNAMWVSVSAAGELEQICSERLLSCGLLRDSV
jgi:hypothetical protein